MISAAPVFCGSSATRIKQYRAQGRTKCGKWFHQNTSGRALYQHTRQPTRLCLPARTVRRFACLHNPCIARPVQAHLLRGIVSALRSRRSAGAGLGRILPRAEGGEQVVSWKTASSWVARRGRRGMSRAPLPEAACPCSTVINPQAPPERVDFPGPRGRHRIGLRRGRNASGRRCKQKLPWVIFFFFFGGRGSQASACQRLPWSNIQKNIPSG